MKIGKSYQEKTRVRHEVPEDRVKFALFPTYCQNTRRLVWLEKVKQRPYFSNVYLAWRWLTDEVGYTWEGKPE